MSIINLNQKPAVQTEVFREASKRIEKICRDEGSKHLEDSYMSIMTKVDLWQVAYQSLAITIVSFSSGYFVYDAIGGKDAFKNGLIMTLTTSFNLGFSIEMLNYFYREEELRCLEQEVMREMLECSRDRKERVFYDEEFDVILAKDYCEQKMVGDNQDHIHEFVYHQ
jgi:hypothetical protein